MRGWGLGAKLDLFNGCSVDEQEDALGFCERF